MNFPGPYELRIFYTVDTDPGGALDHQLRINIDCPVPPDPGDLFSVIDISLAGGGTAKLHTTTLAIVNLIEDNFNSDDTAFTHAELWVYEPASFDATYLTAYDLGLPGTAALATVPASQTIFSFRSLAGGVVKLVLLDTVGIPGVPVAYSGLSAVPQAVVDYWLDDNLSPVLARDGTRPLAFLKLFPGQSEHLFKRRFAR